MVRVRYSETFEKQMRKYDSKQRAEVLSRIIRLVGNPFAGKPMRNQRKGTRELYVGAFRLSYIYEDDVVKIVAVYHKDEQ